MISQAASHALEGLIWLARAGEGGNGHLPVATLAKLAGLTTPYLAKVLQGLLALSSGDRLFLPFAGCPAEEDGGQGGDIGCHRRHLHHRRPQNLVLKGSHIQAS